MKKLLFLLLFLLLGTWTLLGDDVRVLVWDERQPAQKQAYPHFLGNTLASHLNSLPGISALATSLDGRHIVTAGLDGLSTFVFCLFC